MPNLFVWTQSRRDVREVLIERDREASAHIVHSAHILLIQFREIALPQKKVVIILSLSVPGDIYSK